MIQFNLLPDVKLEYVKTQRTKRLLTVIAVLVSAVSLGLLLLSFILVNVVQKKSLRDLSRDVTQSSTKLQSVPHINQVLTVQNQLETLTGLHDAKPVASRIFGYLSQITPSQATLSSLHIDFTANTMTLTGNAPSLDIVSNYTDTLKTTQYTVQGSTASAVTAFKSVVLSSFGRNDKQATFTISLTYDPVIFNSKDAVSLKVSLNNFVDQSSVFQEFK